MHIGSSPVLGRLASLSFSWPFLYGFELVVPTSDIILEFKAGIRGSGVLGHTNWVSSFYCGNKPIQKIPLEDMCSCLTYQNSVIWSLLAAKEAAEKSIFIDRFYRVRGKREGMEAGVLTSGIHGALS